MAGRVEARREYSKAERLERACLRAARNIGELWEEKGSSDTRLLDGVLFPDELTVVGRSLAYADKGHREHVVPRLVIAVRCHEMFAAGASDAEVAQFIREHLAIVLITNEECERLDRKDQFALRQTMPADWAVGGDIFARLTAAGITWRRDPEAHLPG